MERNNKAVCFFIERFGKTPESDPTYYREWEKRINNGTAEAYADKESLVILKEMDLI